MARRMQYPDRNTKIVQMFVGGKTYDDIANELSITRGVVSGAIHRAKTRGAPRIVNRPRKTREQFERNAKIIMLFQSGKTCHDIANELSISKNSVIGIVYRYHKRNKQ